VVKHLQRANATTRARVMALLRVAPRTVDELAGALGVTDNAVRPHLAALEKDGLVHQTGTRRGEGAGKPAAVYELHDDAEPMLSRAYAPVLGALLEVIGDELDPRTTKRVLRETGKRLAAASGGRAAGDLPARARAAAAVLTALGGDVRVEKRDGVLAIRGAACPLASAVSRNPRVCHAVESLVGEISGATAKECCERSGRPRCCFELRSAG
jgi:predicted ArsR family transcriptional regulator